MASGTHKLRERKMKCRLFAMCDRDSVAMIAHPTIGRVPGCHRCAVKLGVWGTPTCTPRIHYGYADTGTYLAGSQGWHNSFRVVDMAADAGFTFSDDDHAALDAYRADKATDDQHETITGQGGLSDAATEYLSAVTADGASWVWDMGELSLVLDCETEEWESQGEECAHCERERKDKEVRASLLD